MTRGNRFKVFAIITDILKKDGEYVKDNGKLQHGAIGWYRVMNPLAKLGADITIGNTIRADYQDALRMKKKGDIWFSKIADNPNIDFIYGAHRDVTGAKFVIDLDDDPVLINEGHPDFHALEERKDMRVRMVKLADHLVVSTEEIAKNVRHLNPYITVIPNAIDPAIWNHKNQLKKDGKIRIGWMSSGSHFADLPIINPVMEAILKKYPQVEFHFAGMTWDTESKDRFFHHVGSGNYEKFPKWYSELGIDIAIAPLKDTPFNRCKSNIKWMEAAMLEIPMVASDVLPYRDIKHGETGFLATNQTQFIKYLSNLIENEELRRKIGKAAKKEILNHWTIDKFLPRYEKLFTKLLEKKDITVVTAITGGKDTLKPQPEYPGVEYVAFVDTNVISDQWITKKACDKFKEPVMNAKIHKILAHTYITTPYIIWIDGSITLKRDPRELIKLMGNKDFAFFKHPGRDCLYEEAAVCVEMNKGNVTEIAEQVREYARRDIKEHQGLSELTCFIRKNNARANQAFEKWWVEVTRFSSRDQISFPVAFRGFTWKTLPGSIEDYRHENNKDIPKEFQKDFPGNKWFDVTPHTL